MKALVNGEERFKALNDQFMVGPCSVQYTLAYSADGENFTAYEESCPANENVIVNGAIKYSWWKLSGNTSTDDVLIIL